MRHLLLASVLLLLGPTSLRAQPWLMEDLGRGVVAVRSSATETFVGWRMLGTDPPEVAFNLYRSTAGGPPVKLNPEPITGATHYVDGVADPTVPNAYFVRPILFGLEAPPSATFTVPAAAPVQPYLRVPLQVPTGGTTPVGEAYTYSPNDTSVGDLDGDGEYELVVKWDPSNSKDNSQSGYTGNVYLDAYTLAGTRLWRIDLGRNVRAGAHYTQLVVYDLDGDGRAEVACKTADGTIDGTGHVIGDPAADWRNTAGYVLSGPEFLTIFDGRTGAALATAPYVVPRGTVGDWGDTYGNRVDRFLATVAYLDGKRPSLVMARGYYTRTVLAAWNWRDGALTSVWTFDTGHTGTPNPFAGWRGMGNHNLSVGDVDGDGRDEIMYGACAIDDDGTGLFTTGLGHGDAIHMTDMDPDRAGLEVFQPHEDPGAYGPNALELRDARTGALVFGVQGSGDIGRGLALDVDPRYRGYEMWGAGPTGGMYTAQLTAPNALLGPRGVEIAATKPSINFGVWWDGDLLRELLDGTTVSKWNWLAGTTTPLLAPAGVSSNNGTKATPNLSADILGDWREEVVWRESAGDALRIYTTTLPTDYRFYTLMHDRQYREAIVSQQTGYNQPPHPSFLLGDGMAPPPVPNIVTSLQTLLGPSAPVFTSITEDTGVSADDFVTRDSTLVLGGTAPSGTTVTVTRFGIGVVGEAAVDGGGHWSLDYGSASLPEGISTFVAAATDAGGTTGALSVRRAVTVDTTPPGAPVIEDVAGAPGLVLKGAAEPGTLVEATLDGAGAAGTAGTDEQGRWTLAYAGPPLSPAPHSFTVTATDTAGNTSAPSAPATTVNTAVASPSILAIADDTGVSPSDGITSDNRLVLTGVAAGGDVVTVTRIGSGPVGSTVADGSGAWTLDDTGTALPDGSHAFRAAATNASGTSPSSPVFVAIIDTSAPSVVSVNRLNPAAASSSAASITFRVTFSEPVSGLDASDLTPVFGDGLAGAISDVSASGGVTADVTIAPLTGQGTVRLDVNSAGTGIADAAGNALGAGFTNGQTFTRLLAGNGVWVRATGGGLWSDNANWQDGIVGSGIGNTATFTSVELVDDGVVHVDAPRTIGNLAFGDTDPASGASWIVDDNGDPANVLTLAVAAGAPTLTVSPLGTGATVTVRTSLAGTAGFTKLGPGALVLAKANTLLGAVNVNGGTLRLDPGSSLDTGAGTVNVGVAAGVQLHVAGGSLAAAGLVTIGSGTGGGNTPGLFTLDSGVAALGAVRTNSDSGSTFRINGGTFSAADVNIRRNSAAAVDFNSGFIVNGGTVTMGTMGLGTNNSNGALTVAGGSLTATGAVTVGNQVTAGRGGAMRVTGGTFTSTDPVNGIVLARTSGTNVNNVASATFTGGVSTAEKLTLGFDATVTAGSATVTLNGGTLYLGSGGIVRNGAGAFATNLSFGTGTLGARASWSTSVPIVLPAGGNVTIKAGDASDVPYDISLAGGLSGPGGLTKIGVGTLALTAVNTFSGPVGVDAGVLRVDGSLGAGEALAVNGGGILGGVGTVDRPVVLGSAGTIRPGDAAPGSALTAATVTWSSGGTLAVDLAAGNRLVVTGALSKAGSGGLRAALSSSSPLAVGTAYTLATFSSTDCTASDFVLSGLSGYRGAFLVDPTRLQFLLTGAGATAAYTDWAYLSGLPAEQQGATQDPDNDRLPNLLEFVLARDPRQPSVSGIAATTITVDGEAHPAITFVRREDRGGVTTEVLASPDLAFSSLLATEEFSATSRGDGTEDVVVRSATPLSDRPNQFFRLAATLPAGPPPDLPSPTTVTSTPVGVMSRELDRGLSGLALPLLEEDLFVGVVASNSASILTFPSSDNLGAKLVTGGRYYVEVATGPLAGERLDVDTDATIAAGDATLAVVTGPGSFGTLSALAGNALAGARCALRAHVTLARLQQMLAPGLVGSDNRLLADAVVVLEGGAAVRYHLRADGVTWNGPGSDEDVRDKVLPPDASFAVEARHGAQAWRHAGHVRTNAFRKNLVRGVQSFASGFPQDLSPAQIGAFVDASAPADRRWTGHNVFALADQIRLVLGEPKPYQILYLRGDGVTWRTLADPADRANSEVLGATSLILLRRINPDDAYRVPLPYVP
jgi:autotransporter-associated beta strand protein